MKITLPHNFTPRPYQVPLLSALDGGIKRAVIVWHRRSGKDKTCLNYVAKKMLERPGAYYYVFPTYTQGKKILWDGIDKDGQKIIDKHFPKEFLDGKPNDTEMKLHVKGGALLQVIGSDNIDSIVGTNPVMVVFAEYSLQDPRAWAFVRPILAENDGIAIFNFTPRGENHAYDIFKLAKSDPGNWFCQLLTVDDTGVLSPEILVQEKREIEKIDGNDALYQQEYYCNFTVPIPGAYYAEHIMRAYQEGRVSGVPHDTRFPVYTFWDLGINDKMSIWFLQVIGNELHLIDYYECNGKGLDHYAKIVKEKSYVYEKHFAPHDIEVRELSTGVSRKDAAENLGIRFMVAPKLTVADGINATRSIFNRCWFDDVKCHDGINALKNFQTKDEYQKAVYPQDPKKYETTTARAIHEVVSVDAMIPGCPIDTGEFVRVVKNLVLGKDPGIPEYPVCVECKKNENVCVYEKGIQCLGPVIRAGCNARCPSNGGYCFGCRGLVPKPNVNSQQEIMQKYDLTYEKMMDKFKLFLERSKEVFPHGK